MRCVRSLGDEFPCSQLLHDTRLCQEVTTCIVYLLQGVALGSFLDDHGVGLLAGPADVVAFLVVPKELAALNC